MTAEQQYLDLGKRLLTEGTWVENERTGKRCLTIINADMIYDVGGKEFPMLSTKQCFWKSAVAEIVGYLRGYTSAKDFRELGTKTWDMNANKTQAWLDNPLRKGTDDMGEVYRFREQGYYKDMTGQDVSKTEEPRDLKMFDTISPDYSVNTTGLVGKRYTSVHSGEFIVVKELEKSKDNRIHYLSIQFLATGYILKVQKSQLRDLNVKDVYYPSVYRVGYLGVYEESKVSKFLKKTWVGMLERCYDKGAQCYGRYGGRGVRVCQRWHCFSNFLEDFEKIYNWELKTVFPKEYSLDKDWCFSNLYSKETCRWSSKKEQARNTKNVKTYKVTKEGTEFFVKGLFGLAELLNITESKAYKITRELPFTYEDYKISMDYTKNIAYVEEDQFKRIYAKLGLGIDDRGLIMDAWQPHLFEYGCLRPCMYSHHFSLLGGTLHLTSYQRSVDYPLGLPFNMLQCYYLLDAMAKITGHKAGKVFHKMVNVHIYEDQIPMFKEQLSRTPLTKAEGFNPKFELPEDLTYEKLLTTFVPSDCTLTGYKHLGKINFPFSE